MTRLAATVVLAAFTLAQSVRADVGAPPIVTLENGVRLVVEPRPGTRTFSLRVAIAGGTCDDPDGKEGASTLLARMLLRSSDTTSTGDRALRLEASGVALEGAAGMLSLTLQADGPSDAFDLSLSSVLDAVSRPRFEASELERETTLARQALAAASDDPSSARRRIASPLLYGNHCLARVPPEDPRDWLTGVDADVLRDVHRERLVGSRIVVVVAGDLDPSTVETLVRPFAASLSRGSGAPESLPAPVPLAADVRARVHRRTSQPEILVAMPTAGVADADAPAMSLLVHILGGFQERLSFEIREQRGWAYWVAAVDLRFPGAGSFGVLTAVPRKRLAETETIIRAQLDRIATAPPSEEEVERSRRFLATQRARARQSSSESAARLARGVLHGIRLRSLDEEAARDSAVTPEEIRALARRLLDSSKLAVVTMY